MDLTKEYQDMLKAAPEIQELWEPNVGDYHTWNGGFAIIGMKQFESTTGYELRDKTIWGDKKEYGQYIIGEYHEWVIMSFKFSSHFSSQSIINVFQDIYKKYDKCIWLPKQDQLQKMVKDVGIVSFSNKIFNLQFEFDNFIMEHRANYLTKFNSMEQLWLAFVMYNRFDKKWNGSSWV